MGANLAKVLLESGGKAILDDINVDRERRIEEGKAGDENKIGS